MSIKRTTKRTLETLQSALGNVNERIREMEAVREGAKSEFWFTLRNKMAQKLAVVENELDSHIKYNSDQRIALLEDRKMLRLFVGIVDDITHDIPMMIKRRDELRVQIRDVQNKLGTD